MKKLFFTILFLASSPMLSMEKLNKGDLLALTIHIQQIRDVADILGKTGVDSTGESIDDFVKHQYQGIKVILDANKISYPAQQDSEWLDSLAEKLSTIEASDTLPTGESTQSIEIARIIAQHGNSQQAAHKIAKLKKRK